MSEGIDSIAVAMNGVSNGEFVTSEQANEEAGDNGQQNYGDLDDPGVRNKNQLLLTRILRSSKNVDTIVG